MKKLLLLTSLFLIAGCSKEQELTLLDRCVASNLDNLRDIEELNLINKPIHVDMKFSNIEKIAIFSLIYNKIEDGTINVNDSILNQMSPTYSEPDVYPSNDEWAVYDLITFALIKSYPNNPSRPSMEFNREFINTFQADFIKLQRDEVESICNSQGIY